MKNKYCDKCKGLLSGELKTNDKLCECNMYCLGRDPFTGRPMPLNPIRLKRPIKIENNKYYTPSLEEFYIGFEYEQYNYDDKKFYSDTIVDCDFMSSDLKYTSDNGFTTIIEEIKKEYIRVKYLDKEDIESLGFTQSLMHKYIFISNEYKPYYNNSYKIGINYDINTHIISIFIIFDEYTRNPTKDIICSLLIKNKSELIKLLKQLNIQ